MIIIKPDFYKGLEFMMNSALKAVDDPGIHKNIINEALAALDEKRNITRQTEHVVTMPSFIVDSNIDGKKYFREVRRSPFFIKSFS